MNDRRFALLIGASHFEDSYFPQLRAPSRDVEDLARVLRDPAVGGFEAKILLDESLHTLTIQIETFFQERQRDDLALLYFSGHGVKDEDGKLYFATTQTKVRLLRSTGLASTFINEVASASRANRQVFFLDCCYSGAFSPDRVPRAPATINLDQHFKSQGRVVLTASDSTQYSFEHPSKSGEGVPRSVFTSKLVEGLATGAADLDGDGLVALDELYEYVYDGVLADTPYQHPAKWDFGVKGRIVLARSPQSLRPAELPVELRESLVDPRSWVRYGAVTEIITLLGSPDARRAMAARLALIERRSDDSQRVRDVVAAALDSSAHQSLSSAMTQESTVSAPDNSVGSSAESAKDHIVQEKAAAGAHERAIETNSTVAHVQDTAKNGEDSTALVESHQASRVVGDSSAYAKDLHLSEAQELVKRRENAIADERRVVGASFDKPLQGKKVSEREMVLPYSAADASNRSPLVRSLRDRRTVYWIGASLIGLIFPLGLLKIGPSSMESSHLLLFNLLLLTERHSFLLDNSLFWVFLGMGFALGYLQSLSSWFKSRWSRAGWLIATILGFGSSYPILRYVWHLFDGYNLHHGSPWWPIVTCGVCGGVVSFFQGAFLYIRTNQGPAWVAIGAGASIFAGSLLAVLEPNAYHCLYFFSYSGAEVPAIGAGFAIYALFSGLLLGRLTNYPQGESKVENIKRSVRVSRH